VLITLWFCAETVAETISLDTFRLLFTSLGEKVPSFEMSLFLVMAESPSSTREILRALVPMFA
jgi:hypothetical protein